MNIIGAEETSHYPYTIYNTSLHNELCLTPGSQPISQPDMDNDEHDIGFI